VAGAAKIAGGDGCAVGAAKIAGGDGCAVGAAKIAGGDGCAVGEKLNASKSSSHCRQNRNAPKRGVPQRGQKENAICLCLGLPESGSGRRRWYPQGGGRDRRGGAEPVTRTE
jgi:hypothetical protein